MRQREHRKAEHMKQRIHLQTQQRTQDGGQVAVGSGVSSASHADGSSQQQQATPAAGAKNAKVKGGRARAGTSCRVCKKRVCIQRPGCRYGGAAGICPAHAQPSGVPPASLPASGLAEADEGMSCAVMEIAGYDGERGVFGQTTVFAFSSRPARALFLALVTSISASAWSGTTQEGGIQNSSCSKLSCKSISTTMFHVAMWAIDTNRWPRGW